LSIHGDFPFCGLNVNGYQKARELRSASKKTPNPPSVSVKRNNVTELLLFDGHLWRLRTRMHARQSSVSGIFEVNIDPRRAREEKMDSQRLPTSSV
jgi:hypothetical protein